MREKISSDARITEFKEQRCSALSVKTNFTEVRYFQTLMKRSQERHLPHAGSNQPLLASKAMDNREGQIRDKEHAVDDHKKTSKKSSNVTEGENEVNLKEQEEHQCPLPVSPGTNGEILQHPSLNIHMSAREEEIKEIFNKMQHPPLMQSTLLGTLDGSCNERAKTSGMHSVHTEEMSLLQCELQELISKNISRMEIQGTHSLSIHPRSDKLQSTLIEIQNLPNRERGIVIYITTSSEEALAVIQKHLGTIHSRFLAVLPFRPLQLKLKFSGCASAEKPLQKEDALNPLENET